MCGIAGVFEYGGGHADPEVLKAMVAAVRHRGPDEGGTWVAGKAGLGVRRLSIIDIDGGHQPMTNEDGSIVVVFNGEIYNYRPLAEWLRGRGHDLKTACDTETIAHLYEERGDDLVYDLRGMFSFAVWDGRRHRLLLARDRIGIKPLYYRDSGDRLLFASEIKSLLEDPQVRPSLDLDALTQYLSLKYVPAPVTMFDGIRSLPPAHLLTCGDDGVRVRRWWDLSFQQSRDGIEDAETCAERLRHLLRDAVRSHLMSDVPFGAFLSGGLDSSVVVALMSEALAEPVKTYSVGYDGVAESLSELPFARLVAQHHGTDHHEVILQPSHLVSLSEKVAWHLDQPLADQAALPAYLVSELASRDVKMVLTGEGGDELFAGYARHSGERLAPLANAMPPVAKKLAVGALNLLPGQRRAKLAAYALAQGEETARFASWFGLFTHERLRGLLTDAVRDEVRLDSAERSFRETLAASDARDPLSRMLFLDTKLWLPDDLLARGDKTSMAASIEARLPLLDHPLVEFAASLPSTLKVRGRSRKYLLRKVARPWLPDPILTRKKQGFPTPVSLWFRGPARGFLRDHLCESTLRRRGLFDPSYVERLLAEHERGIADHGPLLYGLLSFELWHTVFLDGRAPAVPSWHGTSKQQGS